MARGTLARALAMLVALSVVASLGFAGRAFLWCAAMQEARTTCCCAPAAAKGAAPAVERQPCCDSKELTGVPAASSLGRGASLLPPASFAAVVGPQAPYVGRRVAVDARVTPARDRLARAPSRAPPYRLHCAYLI